MSSATGAMARQCVPRTPPASVAGPGAATNVRTAAAHLDQLGEDRERDLLGRLRAEVQAGRRAQRGESLLGDARLLAQPRHGRRRPASATRRARRTRRPARGPRRRPPRPRRPGSRRRRTATGRARGSRSSDPCGRARRPGNRVGHGDRIDQGDTPAGGRRRARRARAAIGVVPATQRSGAGRCGST